MSNLDELIERLCPDGVEYKTIGEVSKFRRGSFPQPYGNKEWYDGEEAMPFVQVADIGNNLRLVDDTKRKISKLAQSKSVFAPRGSVVISIQGSIGRIAITQYDAYIDRTVAIFKDLTQDIITKYFVYQLQMVFKDKEKTARGSTLKTITKEEFTNFVLPVPPLEVQREIVRILDNFIIATTEIQQKLQEELAARQKQYEYYRDLLLTFKPNESTILNERTNELELSGAIRWMKLGDTCVLKAGKAISAVEISQNVNDDYIYPCYGGNGLRGYVKNYNQDGEHPIIGRQGALCGNVCYACNKFYATEHAVVVSPSALYNEKFLFYLLDFAKLEQYKTAGAQPGLSVARLEKVILPVPPLEQQKRIVDILDRFNTLCNDITSGLPAEIEARQKQYEYYRDKLLTFKELKKEA